MIEKSATRSVKKRYSISRFDKLEHSVQECKQVWSEKILAASPH